MIINFLPRHQNIMHTEVDRAEADRSSEREEAIDKPSLSSDTNKLTAVTAACRVSGVAWQRRLPLPAKAWHGTAERDIVMFMPQRSNL